MARQALAAAVLLAAGFVGTLAAEPGVPTMVIGKDHNGSAVLMPMMGVGTWQYNSTVTERVVYHSLQLGVRLIDTAFVYQNQDGVHKGILKSGVPRSEIFILTKVPGGLSAADTMAHHEHNLLELGVDAVDLLLTHFPCGFGDPPQNCSKAGRQATWRGLEALYHAGKARAIGVSHYCQQHLEDVLEIATVPIAVNQQEWHVGMGTDPEGVASFCRAHGISFQSFSPLCGPCGASALAELTSGPLVTSIGEAHGVTGAQVSLRWLVEQGSPVIPKTTNLQHMRDNMDLFSWALTAEELAQLNKATSPPSTEPVSADCKIPELIF